MKQNSNGLFKKIYKLHVNIIKELNNSHLASQLLLPLIESEIARLKKDNSKDDKVYNVPAKGADITARAYRTNAEIAQILKMISKFELYENLLVSNISRFESYLFRTLKVVFEAYPEKIHINVQGIPPVKSIPVNIALKSKSIEEIKDHLIYEKISAVSYAKPADYIRFIGEALSINVDDDCFMDYVEIKAARDIIIHNSGVINNVYLEKVDNRRQGEVGENIETSGNYFEKSIGVMKKISGIIRSECEAKFK